jgi:hypothetical protein
VGVSHPKDCAVRTRGRVGLDDQEQHEDSPTKCHRIPHRTRRHFHDFGSTDPGERRVRHCEQYRCQHSKDHHSQIAGYLNARAVEDNQTSEYQAREASHPQRQCSKPGRQRSIGCQPGNRQQWVEACEASEETDNGQPDDEAACHASIVDENPIGPRLSRTELYERRRPFLEEGDRAPQHEGQQMGTTPPEETKEEKSSEHHIRQRSSRNRPHRHVMRPRLGKERI